MTVGCGDQSIRWTLSALSESGGGEGLDRLRGGGTDVSTFLFGHLITCPFLIVYGGDEAPYY